MKKLLAVVLALALSVSTFAGVIGAPRGYAGKLFAGTFALYGTFGNKTVVCTATPYAHDKSVYQLITAGHCVQQVPSTAKFYVAEEIGGVRTPVTLVKARYEGNMDFAQFTLETTKKYPIVSLGDEHSSHVGDKILNPNFALGLTKQLSHGLISSEMVQKNFECGDACEGDFLVQMYGGSGSSGSVIVSEKSRKVIGICIAEATRGNVGLFIEPISRFYEFLSLPGQAHPQDEAEDIAPAQPIAIPSDVFASNFGEEHPFMLTVRGPNPIFSQGGYNFQISTMGMPLADFYYDRPVFVAMMEGGEYKLQTTDAEGYSVHLTVLSAVN